MPARFHLPRHGHTNIREQAVQAYEKEQKKGRGRQCASGLIAGNTVAGCRGPFSRSLCAQLRGWRVDQADAGVTAKPLWRRIIEFPLAAMLVAVAVFVLASCRREPDRNAAAANGQDHVHRGQGGDRDRARARRLQAPRPPLGRFVRATICAWRKRQRGSGSACCSACCSSPW